MNNKEKGSDGEELAANYLALNGYEIVKRNYRCRFGEIDIIAKKDDTLVFAEVKTRTSKCYGHPREAVGYKKQQVYKRLAAMYLSENKAFKSDCRFDVIEIIVSKDTTIEHIKDAFW